MCSLDRYTHSWIVMCQPLLTSSSTSHVSSTRCPMRLWWRPVTRSVRRHPAGSVSAHRMPSLRRSFTAFTLARWFLPLSPANDLSRPQTIRKKTCCRRAIVITKCTWKRVTRLLRFATCGAVYFLWSTVSGVHRSAARRWFSHLLHLILVLGLTRLAPGICRNVPWRIFCAVSQRWFADCI